MLGRIELCRLHIGAVDQVVAGIDQARRGDDAQIREGLEPLAQHVVEIVRERIVAGFGIVPIRRQVQHRPQLRRRCEAP